MTDQTHILELKNVHALYDGIIRALAGVTLNVTTGRIVALLGANGAGKTTTLKAASRLLSASRGEVTSGTIHYLGESTAGLDARQLVKKGLVQVLEGRHCFPHLTVLENLVAGTFGSRGLLGLSRRAELQQDIERSFERFPRLRDKRRLRAGYLSGGEQQMLAMGRALLAEPRLLVLDEPSMGLAPLMVAEIFDIMARLNEEEGVSILLAEQNARVALSYSHDAYVMETGKIVAHGTAQELRARDDVQEFYLGLTDRVRQQARESAVAPANG